MVFLPSGRSEDVSGVPEKTPPGGPEVFSYKMELDRTMNKECRTKAIAEKAPRALFQVINRGGSPVGLPGNTTTLWSMMAMTLGLGG